MTDEELERMEFVVHRMRENPGPPDKNYDELKKTLDDYVDRLKAGVQGTKSILMFIEKNWLKDNTLYAVDLKKVAFCSSCIDEALKDLKIFLGVK